METNTTNNTAEKFQISRKDACNSWGLHVQSYLASVQGPVRYKVVGLGIKGLLTPEEGERRIDAFLTKIGWM